MQYRRNQYHELESLGAFLLMSNFSTVSYMNLHVDISWYIFVFIWFGNLRAQSTWVFFHALLCNFRKRKMLKYEEYYLLAWNGVQSDRNLPTFRRDILSSSGIYLPPVFWDTFVDWPSCLKIETTCSFETLGNSYYTTRHYPPEDNTLHRHGCEDLRSNTFLFLVLYTEPVWKL
jgi:hypothetical protein